MLSGAKHLQCLLYKKQMQILRFAQDDSLCHFFRGLSGAGVEFLPAVSAALRCDASTSRRYRATLS